MRRVETAPAELRALLETLDDTDPSARSSCPGWTAHHIAAHIAGNYEEVLRHVNAFADGRRLERTRGWDEREKPLRDLDHASLVRRIADDASATAAAIRDVLATDADAVVLWTGREVPVSGFPTHMRSEDALHRWDLVGDDATSRELLCQDDLLVHGVTFIGHPLLERGLASGADTNSFSARVRCPGSVELTIEVRDGEAVLSTEPAAFDAAIETDPGARLLLLWGRKATPFVRLRTLQDEEQTGQIQLLFSGY